MVISPFSRQRIWPGLSACILSLILSLGAFSSAYTQCASVAGPSTPQAASSLSYVGSAFGFNATSNVYADDGLSSFTFSLLSLFGGNTDYLVMTGFTDSIPYYATICGVKVEIKKYATGIGLFASVNDNAVYLVKGGALVGTPKALAADWTGTDSWYTYGSNGDNWGTTLNVSDVTPASFGVAISAKLSGISVAPTARIDNVKITVYYDATTLPVSLSSFNASRSGDASVRLKWAGGNGQGVSQFTVQRSADNSTWQSVDSIPVSSSDEDYTITDQHAPTGTTFYRIAISRNGHITFYSDVKSVGEVTQGVVKIYPNPASNFITIDARSKSGNLSLIDMSGRECLAVKPSLWQNSQPIYIGDLPDGVYAVSIGGVVARFVKHK